MVENSNKNIKTVLKDSIGVKLFQIVFSIYFVLSIAIIIVQFFMEYRSAQNDINNDIKKIKESFNDGIIDAMWNENKEQVKALAKGILKLPAVKGIIIVDNFGESFANLGRTKERKDKKELFQDNLFWIDFNLIKKRSNKEKIIGKMKIFSSTGVAFQRVKLGFYLILFFAILKTMILFLLFFWAFRQKLIVPLNNLASAAKSINMDRLLKINIGIKRKQNSDKGKNELEIVEDSINSMIENLSKAKADLDKYSSELEVEVEKKSVKIETQYKDFKNLLFNLDQGFLTFDKKGLVRGESTEITRDIFDTDPRDKKIEDVLKLSESEKRNFRKWVSHVYKNLVPFKDLLPLAPRVFDKVDGRIISLDYKPIYFDNRNKKIDKIICTATDVTEKVKLEKEAEIEKDKAIRLSSILDRPLEFLDLMSDSEEALDHYGSHVADSRPEIIFRSFHTLKARFGGFRLNDIVASIHELESYLNEIENKWGPTQVRKVRELIEYIKYSRSLFVKENHRLIEIASNSMNTIESSGNISTLKKHIDNFFDVYKKNFILKEVSLLFKQFISPTEELAKQQDKEIDIKIEKSEIFINPDRYKELLSALLHVFRNAIDHGIESREERIAKNKNEKAELMINFDLQENKKFKITIKDDGKGINPKVIKEVGSKKEKLKHINWDTISDNEIIQLIFEPGFSSKDEVTNISGRGVGMDVVKTEVEKLKGDVKVESKVDVGTRFEILIPLYN